MSKLFLSLVALVWVSAACASEDDDDTRGSSGSGGSNAGAGGSSSGQAGSATSGGSSGGNGGSAGTAGSSAGKASGGSAGEMIPRPTGTIGTDVDCRAGGECTGTVCCRQNLGSMCVSDFDDCACSLEGTCTALGCDEPSDCNGGRCCALVNPLDVPAYVATSCKAECGTGERVLCLTDDDCNSGDSCQTGSDFDWCF